VKTNSRIESPEITTSYELRLGYGLSGLSSNPNKGKKIFHSLETSTQALRPTQSPIQRVLET